MTQTHTKKHTRKAFYFPKKEQQQNCHKKRGTKVL